MVKFPSAEADPDDWDRSLIKSLSAEADPDDWERSLIKFIIFSLIN